MAERVVGKEYIAAVDVGSNNIITVVGLKDQQGNVEIVGTSVCPSEGMESGEIRNATTLSTSIRAALDAVEEQLDVKIDAVYTGVAGRFIKSVQHSYHVYVGNRDHEVRSEDVNKINESMLNVQFGDRDCILERITQHYVIDNNKDEMITNPVGMFGRKLENSYLFILGDNTAISRVDNVFSRARVKNTALFVNPIAAAEAVLLDDEKSEGVMLVDIGGGTTNICIYHDNMVRHVAVIPMGGNMINRDIQSFGIMAKHIETLKVGYGRAVSKEASAEQQVRIPGITAKDAKLISYQNLAVIIESRLLDIIELSMAELDRSGFRGKLNAGIVLTGGVSLTQDIDMLVRDFSKMEVRIATPVVNIVKEGSVAVDSPLFSTAVGLLLKGVGSGNSSVVVNNAPVGYGSDFEDEAPEEEFEPAKKSKKSGGIFEWIKKKSSQFMTDVADNEL